MTTTVSEDESGIINAQRGLGLVWVLLPSFRYRTATDAELATIRDLCDRLKSGVPRCQEYNEGVRPLVAEIREMCDSLGDVPARQKIERLTRDMDRLQALLLEYRSLFRQAALAPVAPLGSVDYEEQWRSS